MTEPEPASPTAATGPIRATAIPDEVLFAQLRLDPDHLEPGEAEFARLCLRAAVDYVTDAYGMEAGYADAHESVAIAVLALARDMYDNRTAEASGAAANRTLQAILAAHDFNLI